MPCYQLLGPSNLVQDIDFVGEPVKAAGWFGMPEGLHTVAMYVNNFTGRVFIEGSLSMDPGCSEWFPIKVTGCDYVEFPLIQNCPNSMFTGDTITTSFTFRSNILWLRVRVWRSYFLTQADMNDPQFQYGSISQILVGY